MSTNRAAPRGNIRLLVPLAALLLLATLATPALAHDDSAHVSSQSGQAIGRLATGLGAELAQVRAATARYHDVEVALEDGFVPPEDDHCVVGPTGAMGYHYVSPGRMPEPGGELDPTLPQALLYAPGPYGQLRLVGVEYLSPSADDEVLEQPEVLGQPLVDAGTGGPGPALHVWLWQANPLGMFAPYNPNVSCG